MRKSSHRSKSQPAPQQMQPSTRKKRDNGLAGTSRAQRGPGALALAVLAVLACGCAPGHAQQATPPTSTTPAPAPAAPKPEIAITPAQARELFGSVDTILKFDSQDTDLPIKHTVKRRLTTRKAVEAFLVEKMKEDKDTARVERSGIVLKKFGLLPAGFELRPFLLSLLKEQIAGYYDSKTKTVNLLNWISPEEQKPVLAHELTHALQDQHVDLETWGDQSLEGTPKDVADDNRHLRRDESDTAREAALEGQAMVAYMDWSLAPMAQSLRTSPDIPLDQDDDKADPDSPILSSAPLVLKASLLFPYQDGLRFEQILLKDQGAHAAFAAVLDRPPDSSYEIMHPHEYEKYVKPTLLTLPDLHPLLDAEYKPYDLGVMGELDVRMLGQLFGGPGPAADLAATWDGGVYYAAQSKSAVAAGHGDSTASIGLLYLSQWTTAQAAQQFEELYSKSLSRKYKQLTAEGGGGGGSYGCGEGAKCPPPVGWGSERFSSEEGPIVIANWDRKVLITEGFATPLADQLAVLMGSPHLEAAAPAPRPAQSMPSVAAPGIASEAPPPGELTAPLVRFFGAFGLMKAALPTHAYTELSP
jgi:hypothetical protein